jgi:hypothetical protein
VLPKKKHQKVEIPNSKLKAWHGVHAYNPRWRQEDCELQASLNYIASYRLAWLYSLRSCLKQTSPYKIRSQRGQLTSVPASWPMTGSVLCPVLLYVRVRKYLCQVFQQK